MQPIKINIKKVKKSVNYPYSYTIHYTIIIINIKFPYAYAYAQSYIIYINNISIILCNIIDYDYSYASPWLGEKINNL